MLRKLYRSKLTSGTRTLSNLRLVVKICVGYFGVNLIGLTLAYFWGQKRPLFNLDYLVAGLVFFWISRSVAAALVTGLFVMEIVWLLIPSFFFTQQAFSLLFWMRGAKQWTGSILSLALAGIAVLLLLLVFLFRRYRLTLSNQITATITILGLFGLLVAADTLNGSNNLDRGDTTRFELNIANSPAHQVLRETWLTLTDEPAKFTPIPVSQSATGRYLSGLLPAEIVRHDDQLLADFPMEQVVDRLPEKVVLVVVESLSVLTADPGLRNWLSAFDGLENRYTIESGSFDWMGATRRGEFRELCWQALDGVKIKTVPASLPARFKELQYETESLHGFHETMYNRGNTYPKLGFDRMLFLRDMQQLESMPLAGTLFCGAQDISVAKLVRREIARPGRRLVYWLTLSSHIPVDVSYAARIATPAEQATRAGQPEAIWAFSVICQHALTSIATMAADESLGECDYIIVGDHALPVMGEELKKCIVPNRVPYLILRHKTATDVMSSSQTENLAAAMENNFPLKRVESVPH